MYIEPKRFSESCFLNFYSKCHTLNSTEQMVTRVWLLEMRPSTEKFVVLGAVQGKLRKSLSKYIHKTGDISVNF